MSKIIIFNPRRFGKTTAMRQEFIEAVKQMETDELRRFQFGLENGLAAANIAAINRTSQIYWLEFQLETVNAELKRRQLGAGKVLLNFGVLVLAGVSAGVGIAIGKSNFSGKKNLRWYFSGKFCDLTNWLCDQADKIKPKEQGK